MGVKDDPHHKYSTLNTQHSTLSTQHSALSHRRLISKSSAPTALSWRRFARFASVVISLIFFVPLQAQAASDICGPEDANNRAALQQAQGWYDGKWVDWKTEYNSATTVENDRKAIRNKYITARLAVANEYFRKFASDICERGMWPDSVANALQKLPMKRHDSLEARLVFNRLRALIYTRTTMINTHMSQTTTEYSLVKAEQELSGLDWPLVLYSAINDVEKIKWNALETAASGVPAN